MRRRKKKRAVGVAIPATMAILGVSFACCALLLAGLPPLAGFIAKFLLLSALLHPTGIGVAADRCHGLDTDGAFDGVGIGCGDCHDARRHPGVLGAGGE